MTLNEFLVFLPIIFITKALKMIDATDDEYIEVTLRPYKKKSVTVEIDEERAEE